MQDRFRFKTFYQGRFIYKSLTDANYYDKNNKCIGLANPLPNNLEWEQSTGINDKNGKLIYENDIITCGDNRKWVVFWADTFWQVKELRHDGSININALTWCTYEEIEVIGNIYENKELLEK